MYIKYEKHVTVCTECPFCIKIMRGFEYCGKLKKLIPCNVNNEIYFKCANTELIEPAVSFSKDNPFQKWLIVYKYFLPLPIHDSEKEKVDREFPGISLIASVSDIVVLRTKDCSVIYKGPSKWRETTLQMLKVELVDLSPSTIPSQYLSYPFEERKLYIQMDEISLCNF